MREKQWIEEVLNSTNEIKQLVPNDSLLQDIEARIYTISCVSVKTAWMAAASMVVVVSLNFAALKFFTNNKQEATDSPFYTNNQIY